MASAKKVRVDELLLARGLAPSLENAAALIMSGVVFLGDRKVEKAGAKISPTTEIFVRQKSHPYVSRGGVKLAGALEDFDFDARDAIAADVGSSTGGFTDCLLRAGAKRVYAIDVGYGLLDYRLRVDERVVVMERTNARHLKAESLPERVGLVVVDASFIGLEKLLPAITQILAPHGHVLAMVKPQFQVRRDQLEGGVVRDEDARREAIDSVAMAAENLGLREHARTDTKIRGPKGNLEAFLWLKVASSL